MESNAFSSDHGTFTLLSVGSSIKIPLDVNSVSHANSVSKIETICLGRFSVLNCQGSIPFYRLVDLKPIKKYQ